MALMNRETLRQICAEQKLYRTPALNDKLYCNFKGFVSIGGLEEYTGLKALFLEGNALDTLEGLPELKELRCL
jgi:dynein assembly factor 1